MKRFFLVFLSVLLILSGISTASARTFTSISMLQQFIMNNSPEKISAAGEQYVDLSGVILEIRYTGQSNHYEMTLQIDDPKGMIPLEYDSPVLIVHFRLHVDPIPFELGETVDVFGSLNTLYSSVMYPLILARTINGTEDF